RPVDAGRAVVTPSGTRRVDAEGGAIVGEAVVRPRTNLRHMDGPDASLGVKWGVGGAGVVVGADQRESHYSESVLVDRDGGIAEVCIPKSGVATSRNLSVNAACRHMRPGRKPLDARQRVALDSQPRVQRSEKESVGEHHLL